MHTSYLFNRGLVFGRAAQPPIQSEPVFTECSAEHLMALLESPNPNGHITVREQGFALHLMFGKQHSFEFFPSETSCDRALDGPITLTQVRDLLMLVERHEWPGRFLQELATSHLSQNRA